MTKIKKVEVSLRTAYTINKNSKKLLLIKSKIIKSKKIKKTQNLSKINKMN